MLKDANCAVDDELRQHANRTCYTKHNCVKVLLSEAVVLEEDAGMGIDVGEWVLRLAVLCQDAWGDLVDLAHEPRRVVCQMDCLRVILRGQHNLLEHRVIWKMAESKLAL